MADIEHRVSELETWRNEMKTFMAVRKEKDMHMDDRFDRLEKMIDVINAGLSRVLWILGGSALTAVVAFVFKGGLNV